MDVKVDKHYTHIRIKGQGLGDDLHRSNEEVREAIKTMSADLGLQQSLEVRLLPITLAHHAPPLCAPQCSSWVATRSCERLSLRPNLQMHSSSTAT
jgi:hypothetical protein